MDQKLNYLLFTLVLIGAVSLSQAQSITSIIYDAETKEALPFCTVGIAGKSSGTVANSEGKFIPVVSVILILQKVHNVLLPR